MPANKIQKALYKHGTAVMACSHESDYSVLYNGVDMEHLMCSSCWNEENPVRIDADTVKILRPNQIRTVRLRCIRCGTDVTAQKNCTGCFPRHV